MLRRPIRQTQKSGAFAYAEVEDITLGYATVRLAKNGARMTRLPILGGAVEVGERVVVDWSAGVPPVVRPITTPYEDDEELSGIGYGEGMYEIQSDVSFKVRATTQRLIGKSWSAVTWDVADFQTETFFSSGNPTVLTVPYDGYYFFCANMAVVGFKDWRAETGWNGVSFDDPNRWIKKSLFKKTTALQFAEAELRKNDTAFAFSQGWPMDMKPSMYTAFDVHGMVPCQGGDQITLQMLHTDPDRDNIDLLVHEDGAFTKIWGFRMSRGGWADYGGYSYGSTPSTGDPDDPTSGGSSEQDDDSDIEIRTNMGYLHVSDDSNSTYARGIAMVGDYGSLELTLDYRFEDTDSGAVLRLQLRSSRDWYDWQTPTRGYEMSLNNTGGWGLHQIVNHTRSSLGSINGSGSVLDHKLRFRADGTSIKAKTWLASESEPGSWDLEVSGSLSDWGGLQLGFFNQGGDHKVYIDNLDLHIP